MGSYRRADFVRPCTTAPLSAILLYIIQSGNMCLAAVRCTFTRLGWSATLILVTRGILANCPAAEERPWMETVKPRVWL